ncbi:MAG: DUF3667 domain-containing protein [Pseudomonadota bacterium]
MKPDLTHDDLTHCLNCGAAVQYHFCPVCGQETRLHVPSATEFLHEFVGHYVALEGRLWQTMKLLLFKPGQLTADYIAGRRQRYVVPLRLYLTLSIVFFALLKMFGPEVANFDSPKVNNAEIRRDVDKDVAAAMAKKNAAVAARTTDVPDNEMEDAIRKYSPKVANKFDNFEKLDQGEKVKVISEGFFAYAPYAMFCLMPLFALFLKILYLGSGKRYGEHLLFALHTNAFAYLQIGLIMLAPWGLLKFALFCWLAFYLPVAMRRVYGGSRKATALRWLALMLLHLVSMSVAIGAAFALAVVH